MSSSKRNGKSKTSTQENVRDNVDNCTMQTRKQSITTKVTKSRTADNVTQNTGRLVGKIPPSNPNRRGKKDKSQLELTDSNSSKKGSNDTPGSDDDDDDDDDDDNDDDDDDDNDDDNNNNNNNDNDNINSFKQKRNGDDISQSGFSNGSSEHSTTRKTYKNNDEDDDSLMEQHSAKPLYHNDLVNTGRNNTVAMDVQLIKGVLPDLFAVLKFLEGDDDLVFNGIICRYFIRKLQVIEDKQYEWWKQNSNAVRKSIDGRRASVSNLIKKSFMGKLCKAGKLNLTGHR